MIKIDEAFVNAAAPNANAVKSAKDLLLKRKFSGLYKSEDETLLFGECKGSEASDYQTSVDFMTPEQPVYRCTCPSRQFPCKHCLGLMYAFAKGESFKIKPIPEDIAQKRAKAAKRSETKKDAVKTPPKVNKSALKKKIKSQLDGLDLLETLTHDLIRAGLGNLNAKSVREIETQAKQLGDAYLPGAQNALYDFTNLFYTEYKGKNISDLENKEREKIYSEATDRLIRLQSLCRHGRAYLNKRLDDPELKPDIDSDIAAWLGHAWQLRELGELGLMQENVELIQLSFHAYNNFARKQFIETGIWLNLSSGHIQLTQNFRPHKAAKHIREEDALFNVAQVKELFIYPGDMNPRIRWEGMLNRESEPKDYSAIHSFARSDFAQVIKEVKNQIKLPLADKSPVLLLRYKQIGKVADHLVMEDANGERLILEDTDAVQEPESCHLLSLIHEKYLKEQSILGRFHHNLDTHQLRVKPLSIITDSDIIRLVY